MSRAGASVRRLAAGVLVAVACLAPTPARAQQAPWLVTVAPTMNPLPIGACAAVWVQIMDRAIRDTPRNPQGQRVSIADFDMTVATPDGAGAAGKYAGAGNWSACACQAATPGTVATVTARYPAEALPAARRVAGVTIEQTATFTIAKAQGTFNPPECLALSPTAVAMAPPTVAVEPEARRVATSPRSAPAVAPVPVNPSGFAATQTGPGQVQLSWYPVSAASYYVLLGPGLPSGGTRVAGATTFIATGVPAGPQQWAVASYYEPGPVSTPASAFPRVSIDVVGAAAAPPVASAPPAATPPANPPAVAAGHYLVTVTGLRAYLVSTDDPLSRDGVGDEVYAAAYVRRYDRRTGRIADTGIRRTMPYGDVKMFGTQRIQAGRWSATGGISDGDPIPDGAMAAMRKTPAQDATFPWRLWEGTLTDGVDALVISPSIWEQDGDDAYYKVWTQQQAMQDVSLFANQKVQDQINERSFGALIANASAGGPNTLGTGVRNAQIDIMIGLPLITLLRTSVDRPIGLLGNELGETVLPGQAVVLTREIVEAALARPSVGMFPSPSPAVPGVLAPVRGVMMLEFYDGQLPSMLGTARPARYQMYVQVERLP